MKLLHLLLFAGLSILSTAPAVLAAVSPPNIIFIFADDLGWGEHGGTPYSFRTPPLRQVAETAPYLHAGTAPTLIELLRFKNRGRSEHPAVSDDRLSPLVGPLGLSEAQLLKLALIMNDVYRSVDVAFLALREIDARNGSRLGAAYMEALAAN